MASFTGLQDVVKNFPLMSSQERFLSTVRAVGEGRLVDDFSRLKDIQKTIDDSDALLKTKERTQEDLRNKMEGIKGKKMKLDSIGEKQEERNLVEKKLKWVRFENDIKDTKKIKKCVDDVKSRVEMIKGRMKELQKIEGEKESGMEEIQARLVLPEKAMKHTQKLMADSPVEQKLRDLEHLDELLAGEEENKTERLKNIERVKEEVAKLSRELAHHGPEQELDKELARLREKELQLDNKLQTLVASKTDYTSKGRLLDKSLKEVIKYTSAIFNRKTVSQAVKALICY